MQCTCTCHPYKCFFSPIEKCFQTKTRVQKFSTCQSIREFVLPKCVRVDRLLFIPPSESLMRLGGYQAALQIEPGDKIITKQLHALRNRQRKAAPSSSGCHELHNGQRFNPWFNALLFHGFRGHDIFLGFCLPCGVSILGFNVASSSSSSSSSLSLSLSSSSSSFLLKKVNNPLCKRLPKLVSQRILGWLIQAGGSPKSRPTGCRPNWNQRRCSRAFSSESAWKGRRRPGSSTII